MDAVLEFTVSDIINSRICLFQDAMHCDATLHLTVAGSSPQCRRQFATCDLTVVTSSTPLYCKYLAFSYLLGAIGRIYKTISCRRAPFPTPRYQGRGKVRSDGDGHQGAAGGAKSLIYLFIYSFIPMYVNLFFAREGTGGSHE